MLLVTSWSCLFARVWLRNLLVTYFKLTCYLLLIIAIIIIVIFVFIIIIIITAIIACVIDDIVTSFIFRNLHLLSLI